MRELVKIKINIGVDDEYWPMFEFARIYKRRFIINLMWIYIIISVNAELK